MSKLHNSTLHLSSSDCSTSRMLAASRSLAVVSLSSASLSPAPPRPNLTNQRGAWGHVTGCRVLIGPHLSRPSPAM